MNLDALKDEIPAQLDAAGFAVFHGDIGAIDSMGAVAWNDTAYPDYQMFLNVARRAGAILIYFAHREFEADEIEDELSELTEWEIPHEQRRQYERRLRSFKGHEGRTCAIVLAFDHGSRFYTFDLVAPWYQDFLDLSDEISENAPDDDEPEPMGPYFSNN